MFKVLNARGIVRDAAGEAGAAPPPEAPAEPVAPWAGSEGAWTVGEGDAAKPWHAFIPEEEARQHIEAKGYKTPAELALANWSLTKLQRGDPTVVGVPGAEAAPEAWSEFYGKLGRPETPEGYDFKFAPDVQADDAMVNFARNAFHEAGLTPKQAQIVADKWNALAGDTSAQTSTATAEKNDAELTALTETWGPDLERNKAAGQRVMKSLGLDAGLVDRIEQAVGSAAVVELLAKIGRKSDEGGMVGGDPATGGGVTPDTATPAQAQAKIAELQADPAFQAKYTDANSPGHKEAVELMARYFARA